MARPARVPGRLLEARSDPGPREMIPPPPRGLPKRGGTGLGLRRPSSWQQCFQPVLPATQNFTEVVVQNVTPGGCDGAVGAKGGGDAAADHAPPSRGWRVFPTLPVSKQVIGQGRSTGEFRRAARRIQEPVRAGRPVRLRSTGEQAGASPLPALAITAARPCPVGPGTDTLPREERW